VLEVITTWASIRVLGLTALMVPPATQIAQDTNAGAAVSQNEERRQRWRACAVAMGVTRHDCRPTGGLVTCNLERRWSRETLNEMLGVRLHRGRPVMVAGSVQ
jgi:hypothetical protein